MYHSGTMSPLTYLTSRHKIIVYAENSPDGSPGGGLPPYPFNALQNQNSTDIDVASNFLSQSPGTPPPFNPTKILREGWIYKKATGVGFHNVFGRRNWAPRWAKLVLARMPGTGIDVPVLYFFWYEFSVGERARVK